MASSQVLVSPWLIGLAVLAVGGASHDYDGVRVIKVPASPYVRRIVSTMGLDIWGGNKDHLDVEVPKDKMEQLAEVLEGVPYRVMIHDLQAAISSQTRSNARSSRAGVMNWNDYQRLDTIYKWMDDLEAKNPKRVTVGEIGKTFEKRPIKYVKVSSGKAGAKAVLVDAGIHAREWISPASVTWVLRELVENPSSLPSYMRELDWYVIPVLNPDGYEFSHTKDRMWRKNRSPGNPCPGSDINRNFDYKWRYSGTSSYPCDENFGGKAIASELETKALKKFAQSIPNLQAYMTFHSYGQMILFPFSHEPKNYPPDVKELRSIGEEASQAIRRAGGPSYSVGTVPDQLGYGAGGGTIDWMKVEGKVRYAFGVELRDAGDYGFVLPAKYILPTARDALEFVKVVAAAAQRA